MWSRVPLIDGQNGSDDLGKDQECKYNLTGNGCSNWAGVLLVRCRPSRTLVLLHSVLLMMSSASCVWAKNISSVNVWGENNRANLNPDAKSALLIKPGGQSTNISSDSPSASPNSLAESEEHAEKKEKISLLEIADPWTRYYEEGKRDYATRRYETAEARFLAAVKAAKQGMDNERRLIKSRIFLGKVYLAKQLWDEAEKAFSLSSGPAKESLASNLWKLPNATMVSVAFIWSRESSSRPKH